ncbi:uncharacterized protein LOC110980045 [Acanthaster planci]|uniref:Uncharacterized protein LOC110980045 n=1 Tax=Acanthaster planci TaxID=133434 RepID=A0A8B7YFL9_ACAPL|nr:uncharacterized protein LOC110980045 [Acanthaster planci]
MRMTLGISGPNMSFLSAVYSQSWPAPDPNKQTKRGFQGRLFQQSRRRNKTAHPGTVSPRPKHGRDYELQGCRGKGLLVSHSQQTPKKVSQQLSLTPSRHAGLDQTTYKWKTWTNFQQERENDQNDLTLYKITQDTFRKLSAQVHQVNQQISKYHGTGFKSFYSSGDRMVRTLRPSQLAASLPHQAPSIGSAPAGEAAVIDQGLAFQCTPVKRSNRRRPHSSIVVRSKQQQPVLRPHSTSALSGRQAEFDQLTPRIIGALSDGKQIDSDASHPGPFDIVSNDGKPEIVDAEKNQSGEDSEDSSHKYRVRTPPNFDLPPEDLDVDNYRGMFRYHSSSAGKKKQDPFPEALSKPYCYLDLLELSLLKEDWRHAIRAVPDGVEEKLIDRLIEMERLQITSAEWEKSQRLAPPKRAASATQVRKGWNATAALPTERAQSALARSRQSRNCSPDCLQPLCAGECKIKRDPPSGGCCHCKQAYCQGSCTEFGYHLHIRQPRQAEEEESPPRPKSCKSCTTGRTSNRKSTANTNTAVLGRPKSAFATFSSARQMVRKPRPISAVALKASEDLANLELSSAVGASGDQSSRPKTASSSSGSRLKSRGRDSMLPGKSFTSQRRRSLTDEPISTSAAKMNPKPIRVKSAKLKAKQKSSNKR